MTFVRIGGFPDLASDLSPLAQLLAEGTNGEVHHDPGFGLAGDNNWFVIAAGAEVWAILRPVAIDTVKTAYQTVITEGTKKFLAAFKAKYSDASSPPLLAKEKFEEFSANAAEKAKATSQENEGRYSLLASEEPVEEMERPGGFSTRMLADRTYLALRILSLIEASDSDFIAALNHRLSEIEVEQNDRVQKRDTRNSDHTH